jgi:gliding motility-associated lipoprotein GldH
MKKLLLLAVVFTFLLSACDNRTVFKQYKTFDKVSWNRFDILLFEVPVKAGDALDFKLALRHHTYYPYDYIDANITFYTPSGEMRSADYHFELKDENGRWKANGMGELWDIELPVREELRFQKDGICKVRVENKMTKIETPGIVEVGLIVTTTNN